MNLTPLRAGPLLLAFDRENAGIRHLFAGAHEVLRGISAPVRDAQWRTIRPEVTRLDVVQHADGFRVTFQVRCRSDEIDFRWRGTITGDAGGSLAFDFDGEALCAFARNRIGFCVLHPAEAAGRSLIVEHTDGRREAAQFPEAIAPHQPFLAVRALTQEYAPGQRAEVRMEGDTFEMEDQRNWTDASFKTYCTPLELPHPVTISEGTRIRQRVTLQLLDPVPLSSSGFTPPWTPPTEVRIEIAAAPAGTLPALGTQWRGGRAPATIAALRLLRLAHLRIDLWLAGADWRDSLSAGASAAAFLTTALEIAVTVDENHAQQFLQLRDALFAVAPSPPISRWLVFHEKRPSTPSECIVAWRVVFAATPFAAPLGGGATDNFTELNRGREISRVADFTVQACNPQVHAFDERSMVETLAIQGATVAAARSFPAARPAVVSPITLTPRETASATPSPQSAPATLYPFRFDERLTMSFAAAWTLGSLAALANAGATSLTYFEAWGVNGLLGPDAAPRPVFHLFELLASFPGARVWPVTCSHPLIVAALALEDGERRVLLAATFGQTPRIVRASGAWGAQDLTVGPQPAPSVFRSEE